jgi:Transposase, Mutator family
VDTRAGHYVRKLETKAGSVKLKVPNLRNLPFERAIINRYRRGEASVEESLVEMYLAGVSDLLERIAIGASPRSASWTQRRNRLAFNPRARAMEAIDTPGCWQAPTASALKNKLWCPRRRQPVVRASELPR